MKARNKMNIDHALILASELGGKLHSEFLKLFSSEIEDDELTNNQTDSEGPQKNERFLDRT
jgi:hypothetical protein